MKTPNVFPGCKKWRQIWKHSSAYFDLSKLLNCHLLSNTSSKGGAVICNKLHTIIRLSSVTWKKKLLNNRPTVTRSLFATQINPRENNARAVPNVVGASNEPGTCARFPIRVYIPGPHLVISLKSFFRFVCLLTLHRSRPWLWLWLCPCSSCPVSVFSCLCE